jgi:aromatic ring hydroxylase
MDSPGLIFLCRDSVARANVEAFDQPLSGRFDEQDAFAIFDNVEIPKHCVFNDGRVDLYNRITSTGFFPNMQQQTTIRALVKLELAYGLGARMAEIINDTSEATQEMLGEILCYAELTRSALLLAEEHAYDHGDGVFFPDARPLHPLRAMMTQWIPRAMEIVKLIGSHNLLATPNRHMLDTPRLRPLIDAYMKGANEHAAERRAAVFRLAWDFVGSGLAGRQELYERFYIGSGRSNRKMLHVMQSAMASANARSPAPPSEERVTTRERADAAIESILSRRKAGYSRDES